jgi:hypothetical protein
MRNSEPGTGDGECEGLQNWETELQRSVFIDNSRLPVPGSSFFEVTSELIEAVHELVQNESW